MSLDHYTDVTGKVWIVECDAPACRSGERLFYDEMPDAAAIRADGWQVSGRSHTCPACVMAQERRELPPAIEPRPGQPWAPVSGRIGGTEL